MNQPTTPNTVEDFLPLPTPAWARDVHGETEVYTADQVRAAILADRARLAPAAPSGESIAPRRPGGTLTPEADEFVRLMTAWRFADVGDASVSAFNAVVTHINGWASNFVAPSEIEAAVGLSTVEVPPLSGDFDKLDFGPHSNDEVRQMIEESYCDGYAAGRASMKGTTK